MGKAPLQEEPGGCPGADFKNCRAGGIAGRTYGLPFFENDYCPE